ncbi:phage tail assembly chaperone GT [Bacillus sp. GMa5/2]
MVKEGGQSVNDVLDMPFYFVFDELNGETKKKTHKDSIIQAFL